MNTQITSKQLLGCIILSAYSVLFLWNFFYSGIYALGFNISVFWISIITLFFYGIEEKKSFLKNNAYWYMPLLGIILSFSIYENPFLKTINIFLVPVVIVLFFNLVHTNILGSTKWNLKILADILYKKIYLNKGKKEIESHMKSAGNLSQISGKIITGLCYFIIINAIIIGLLASADSNFASIITNTLGFISMESFLKVIFFILLSLILISVNISWKMKQSITNNINEKKIDDIISGIVLGGTLFIYIVFIYVQVDSIFTQVLPDNKDDVVNLVKNGFWQLFFISIINIMFFFTYYRKTSQPIQKILMGFIIASVLILFSAGNKMLLYIGEYGLSYEKFFASYTVLYFAVLFIVMLALLFKKQSQDILKTSMILALSMYSFLTIMPVERIIFYHNVNVSQESDTKIQKYQSHILSSDILGDVKNMENTKLYTIQDWKVWIEKKEKIVENKKWYEKNLSNYF